VNDIREVKVMMSWLCMRKYYEENTEAFNRPTCKA